MRDKRGRTHLCMQLNMVMENCRGTVKASADPLHAEIFDTKRGHNCLHAACALRPPYSLKAAELVETLVQDGGYGISVPDGEGNSCLHLAAETGNKRLIKKLIDLGCDARVVNKEGRTPLHSAAAYGHAEAVLEILNQMSSPQSFAALKDSQGNTAVQLGPFWSRGNRADPLGLQLDGISIQNIVSYSLTAHSVFCILSRLWHFSSQSASSFAFFASLLCFSSQSALLIQRCLPCCFNRSQTCCLGLSLLPLPL